MTCSSVLARALKTLANAERNGKRQAVIRPASKVIVKFLQVMQKKGYVDTFELIDDNRAGKVVVTLNGRLNKCGAICPRYDAGCDQFETWVKNVLPSRQFGYVVLTTSLGIMDHEEARKRNTGGKVIGFFY